MVMSAAPTPPPPQQSLSGAPAAVVLASLLDRSVDVMAEAAADARRYDREAIREASDVWDNNVFPLFWAVSTPGAPERERRAREVLAWMAGHSDRRRAWLVEQAAIAGWDAEPLLPPAVPATRLGRDHAGRVMAPVYRLTPPRIADLLADYDLGRASVRHLQVERAGARLTAFLVLGVERTFPSAEVAEAERGGRNEPPARLQVWLDGLTEVSFDLADSTGAGLRADEDDVLVSLGGNGRLRATGGQGYVDDFSWHLSGAGREADANTRPREPRSGGLPQAPGAEERSAAPAAASLLRDAMLELRSVRYAEQADRVPVLDLCRAFRGAGTEVREAGSRHDPDERAAAFDALVRTWVERGGPRLRRWFRYAVDSTDPVEEQAVTGSSTTPSAPPPEVALVMASWSAAEDVGSARRPASALLQLALPSRPADGAPVGPWRLHALSCAEPHDFRVRHEAFDGAGPLTQIGKPTSACALDIHRGALHVASATGWSRSLA
ncbi:hypothetical protein [Streptomyces sp. NPDC097619]|uniref:hypothetical protein n=1 Tax=Streptomyces sp. NPDC097619 TaxID=3157228 RepID=UPI003327AC02